MALRGLQTIKIATACCAVVVGLTPHVAAGQVSPEQDWGSRVCEWDQLGPEYFARDPSVLAATWLPVLGQLLSGIPELSPDEVAWLEGELYGVPYARAARAAASLEFSILFAHNEAATLATLASGAQNHGDRGDLTRDWLLFAYTLTDDNGGKHLSRLLQEGVISLNTVPEYWMLYVQSPESSGSTRDAINQARTELARFVLACTLPAVQEIQMVDQP